MPNGNNDFGYGQDYSTYDWLGSPLMTDFSQVQDRGLGTTEWLAENFGFTNAELYAGALSEYDPTQEVFAGEAYGISKTQALGVYDLASRGALASRESGLGSLSAQGTASMSNLFSKEAQGFAKSGAAGVGGAQYGAARGALFGEIDRKGREIGETYQTALDTAELSKTTALGSAALTRERSIYASREEYMEGLVAEASDLTQYGAEVAEGWTPGDDVDWESESYQEGEEAGITSGHAEGYAEGVEATVIAGDADAAATANFWESRGYAVGDYFGPSDASSTWGTSSVSPVSDIGGGRGPNPADDKSVKTDVNGVQWKQFCNSSSSNNGMKKGWSCGWQKV